MLHRCKRFIAGGLFVLMALSSAALAAESDSTSLAAAEAKTKVVAVDAAALLKDIAAHRGKVVVVNVFASWCPPCRIEAPGLIAARKHFTEEDMYMVGVSVDKTPAALHAFLNDYPFNYPMFMAEGSFVETFGVNAIPQLLIYDRKGELVVNHKGLLENEKLIEFIEKEVKKKK